MPLVTLQDLQAEAKRKAALRMQGIESAQKVADEAASAADALAQTKGGVLSGMDKAAEAGAAGIRSQAAQALAAGQATGANPFGALGQIGKQAGQSVSEFGAAAARERGQTEMELTDKIGSARQDAAAQKLEAIKFEQEAGSTLKDKQLKQQAYDAQVQKIREANTHWYGDDEQKAYNEIMAMVAAEEDPEVKAYYEDYARKVRDDVDGYAL